MSKGLGDKVTFKPIKTSAGKGRDSIIPTAEEKSEIKMSKRNSSVNGRLINKSFSIEEAKFEGLREYAFHHRMSASAIVNDLIGNYLKENNG